ncbi:peptide deformylase [uncultured Paludibaculum sp.]|uniref:peptide deformylase n=1 Tax=uncultured Paludibaculum sp. TaxID=1765020 RepID=UPI002AAAD59D|nr:peptide deformylase [uncultured Paludibaculum sp.]
MVLRIVKYGDPVLEQAAKPIAEFGTPELKQLVEDMFETMYANKGVGLAAPQVALSQRLTVIDPSAGEDPAARLVLINPEIIAKEGSQIGEEGCLSIPGFREDVKRFNKVRVRAQNVDGEAFEADGEELLARAMQHEIDHLNGVLFISHLSILKRDLIRRKIRKLAKAGEWD